MASSTSGMPAGSPIRRTRCSYGGTLTTNGSPTILTIGNLPNSNFTYAISITTPHQVNLVVGCPTCTATDPFTTWQNQYFTAGELANQAFKIGRASCRER